MSNAQTPGQNDGYGASGAQPYGQDQYGQGQYGEAPYGQAEPDYSGQTQSHGAEPYGQADYSGGQDFGQQSYGGDYSGQYGAPAQGGYEQYPAQGGQYAQPEGQYGYSAADAGYGANPYGATAAQSQQPSGLLAILALVSGGLALLLSFVPAVGILFAGLFIIAAIVLGIIALVKKGGVRRGLAIAGLALAGLAAVIGIANAVITASLVSNAWTEASASAEAELNHTDGTANVELRVTSSSTKPVSVDYSITNGLYSGDNEVNVYETSEEVSLPFSYTIDVPYRADGYESIWISASSADSSDYNTEYTCEILVNGVVIESDTSTYAYCSLTDDLDELAVG